MEGLCEQFGEKGMLDVVEEFNKLRQGGLVQAYQQRFEELKVLILLSNPTLTEGYFVSSFISTLNNEVRPTVKMFRPKTVQQAIEYAKLQELTVEALVKKQRGVNKGWQTAPLPPNSRGWGRNRGPMGSDNKGLAALPTPPQPI